MLALAHKIENAIHCGVAQDRADVARRLGLTRTRVTQLLGLTLLTPEIQEAVLGLESVDGVEPVWKVARTRSWVKQRSAWPTAHRPEPDLVEPNEDT